MFSEALEPVRLGKQQQPRRWEERTGPEDLWGSTE